MSKCQGRPEASRGGGGGGVSGTSDTATASLEAWGLGHLTSLHTQEGSQQQWQEDLHSGGIGVWLGSQEAAVSLAPKRWRAGGQALLLPVGSELLALGNSWRPHFVDGGGGRSQKQGQSADGLSASFRTHPSLSTDSWLTPFPKSVALVAGRGGLEVR